MFGSSTGTDINGTGGGTGGGANCVIITSFVVVVCDEMHPFLSFDVVVVEEDEEATNEM